MTVDSNTIIYIIGGIIILAFFVVALVVRFKRNPSKFDKEQAQQFIEGLSDSIYERVLFIITSYDFLSYDNLPELEVSILNDLYDGVWEYVEAEIAKASQEDLLTAMAAKVINKEFVDRFVNLVFDEINITSLIESKWTENHNVDEEIESVESEDINLQDKFSNQEEYVENSYVEDLPPASEPTEEELANIIPPVDEVEYSDDDETVEVIEDTENATTYLDKRGRKRDKKTGRYV